MEFQVGNSNASVESGRVILYHLCSFVLAAELLQFVVNDALIKGHLKLPIAQPSSDFPIVQYADDTLLIMEANVNQLVHLKGLLDLFAL